MYSKDFTVSQKFPNVEDQHNTPHSKISISFKCFLTEYEDLIVDCSTRESRHGHWKPCCQGAPAPIWAIKNLSGVQLFFIIEASSDN